MAHEAPGRGRPYSPAGTTPTGCRPVGSNIHKHRTLSAVSIRSLNKMVTIPNGTEGARCAHSCSVNHLTWHVVE